MGLWVGGDKNITRVVFYEPPPKTAERYPFACVFKEANAEEVADPERISGIHVEFSVTEQYVACAHDGEILIFRADRECEEAEQERLKIEPAKVEKEVVKLKPAPGKLIIPGQAPPQGPEGAILKETWGKAWSVTAITDPSPELEEKVKDLLGKVL